MHVSALLLFMYDHIKTWPGLPLDNLKMKKKKEENMTCIVHVSVTFMASYILVFEIKLMGIVRTSHNVLGDVSTSVPL